MPEPYSYQWTTNFATPAALSGFAIAADTDNIALVASWTASADAFHYEYLVEAQADDGAWAEVGRTTATSFSYYFANLNKPVRMRVSDSNGALYSTPTEGVGTLTYVRWAMSHKNGDNRFIHELRHVMLGVTTDLPLDQTALQPLSGVSGPNQFPIVFTGQWQGERFALQIRLLPIDSFLRTAFINAALETVGNIALKDPKGGVYVVQTGALRFTDLGAGHQMIDVPAIRVA